MNTPTTQTKTAHTATPWRTSAKFEPYQPAPTIYSGTKQIAVCKEGICFTQEDVTNAQFIVTAVNCHEELLSALKIFMTLNMHTSPERMALIRKTSSDAISKAEEKS